MSRAPSYVGTLTVKFNAETKDPTMTNPPWVLVPREPTEECDMRGVCYRIGAPTETDYDEAIEALKNARRAYIFGDSNGCRVCEDSGHGANQCHHNPLLLARKWAAATDVWQCWHCGFVATNDAEGREHFGDHDAQEPACRRVAPEALDRLAAFERQVSETRGSFITALQGAYGIDGEFIDATNALTADLRALLKAVGR